MEQPKSPLSHAGSAQARRLSRTEEFGEAWRPLVVALMDLGERYVELEGGDAVAKFIERSITSLQPT